MLLLSAAPANHKGSPKQPSVRLFTQSCLQATSLQLNRLHFCFVLFVAVAYFSHLLWLRLAPCCTFFVFSLLLFGCLRFRCSSTVAPDCKLMSLQLAELFKGHWPQELNHNLISCVSSLLYFWLKSKTQTQAHKIVIQSSFNYFLI